MDADPGNGPSRDLRFVAETALSHITVTFLAFLIQIINLSLTSCLCGHFCAASLLGVPPAMGYT